MSKIFIVHAHPEAKSLTGALKDHAVDTFIAQGHSVRVSDLYQMGWKAVADREDFLKPVQPERLVYALESGNAFAGGSQSADIVAEQEKLLWADAVLLSFPMWWFGMPAILKGWVERVFAFGFAYGGGGERYGEGGLSGRRAMLIITIGGHESHYSLRGVNGALDDVLWPIQHGVLFYPGMAVLPPFVLHQTHQLTDADWPEVARRFQHRLAGVFTDRPIPFRSQNGGHYDERHVLKAGLGEGESGTRIHLIQSGDPQERLREVGSSASNGTTTE
jgi:NAD(P)H dehydrogenase (quinone)